MELNKVRKNQQSEDKGFSVFHASKFIPGKQYYSTR